VYRLRVNQAHLTAIAMAVLAGVLMLFSHAPYSIWALSFVAPGLFVAAVWHRGQPDSKRLPAAIIGAVFGASFFGPLLSWLILPAGIVGWGLLVLTQMAFMSVLAVIMRRLSATRFAALVIAATWVATDVIRGMFPLGGFEWGALAYVHAEGSWLLPVARIAGANAITFLVVALSVAALQIIKDTFSMARNRADRALGTTLSWRHVPTATLLASLFLSVLLTIEPPGENGSRDVLAVQGNAVKHWEPDRPVEDSPLRIANAHAQLSAQSVQTNGVPDLILWPESAIDRDPFSPRGQNLLPAIEMTAAFGSPLIAGITLDGPNPRTQRYVGAAVFNPSAQIVDQYTKRQLVPFGEYVPWRRFVDWFPPLAQIPRDAIAGTGPDHIVLSDGTRIAVAICFETMFSSVVRSNIVAGEENAQMLVVLTNNASFGVSGAPHQHVAQSQLRAVETGRWVVHAAISGASAIIDPHGRIHEQTDLFTLDVLRADIPLVDGNTPYLVTGDWVGSLSVLSVVSLLLIRLRYRTSH
jgi:apolipoprotein N-acyltransferase